MAIVDARGFNLTPDTSGIANQLLQAFQIGNQNQLAAQEKKETASALVTKKNVEEVGAQALTVRDEPNPTNQRTALLKLSNEALRNGKTENSNLFFRLFSIQDDDELNLALTQTGVRGADAVKLINDRLKPKEPIKPSFSQGSGKMSGFTFDNNTGEYSIDPELEKSLLVDSQNKAATEGMLDNKKIADINDKVTGLTKDVSGIVEAANSLDALKDRGSMASQLAAVFKFMKANDPSSTVREGELGMVYSAEGAMAGFANTINGLLGKGKLSKTGFLDIVNTAKTLANSAVKSTGDTVTNYLNVLQDKIPEKDFKALLDRVPASFEINPLTPEEQAELDALEAEFGNK